MKILFVCSGNSKFGINPIVKNQGDSICNKGIEVDYFPIHGKGIWGYLKHLLLLRRQIQTVDYSIVHAHYGLCGVISAFTGSHKHLVVSYMGDDLIGSVGKDGQYTNLSKILVALNKYCASFVNRYTIVKSQNIKNVIGHLSNVTVLPNGVDYEKFYPVEQAQARRHLELPISKPLVIFVSDPARREKNFQLLEKALAYLEDNILLKAVYNIPQKELKYFYSAADVLVLTSLHEGSPNVIKEAMACSCPIVSTDVGDVREVTGKTSGCYITSFEPEDVADKINLALQFGKRTNGREQIKHLAANVIAEKISGIYQTVLQ